MVPDSAFKSILGFCIIVSTLFISPAGETSGVVQNFIRPGYCMQEGNGSTVYFSAIYDIKLPPPARFSTNIIGREFIEYLKGRYDLNPTTGFPASCPLFGRISDAEASKSQFEAQARGANKQVVQTNWSYVIDPDFIAAAYTNAEDPMAVVAAKRKPTHTYCMSDSAQGTLYTTGPVETGQAVNLSFWYRGFDQMLRQKYGFKGQVHCNVGPSVELTRLMAARAAGAREAGKKIVNTGWKYDASAMATSNPTPAQRDNDPEPVQRPAPPNPSREASDIAIKEMPESVAYCKKDATFLLVFNCDSFGRVVYNYRMAHLGEAPETVASLMAAKKLNCAECIDNTRLSLWVEKRAAADNLSPQATNCVSQNVIVTLYKTPEANRLTEFYKQAVATCNKQ